MFVAFEHFVFYLWSGKRYKKIDCHVIIKFKVKVIILVLNPHSSELKSITIGLCIIFE